MAFMTTHDIAFVPETRIGFWFLGTETWTTRVLRVARAFEAATQHSAARPPIHAATAKAVRA